MSKKNGKIQANLNPETIDRCAKIAGMYVTRGIDKIINQALDNLEARNT